MLKVGLISDSHRRDDVAKFAIDYLLKKEIDLLIHAGDIVEEKTLFDMKNCGVPYVAVLGNNDFHLAQYMKKFKIFNEPHLFEFRNFKFKLMHRPFYLNNVNNDVVVYGHTHKFIAGVTKNTLFINPGEICARNKGLHEFAYFTCQKNDSVNKFEVYKVESLRDKFEWKESKLKL